MNIILVSDSLAKSRSVTLSQTQVLLIAFGILLSGFVLAMATYFVTMKFAVDIRNPYLRSLVEALHQDDLRRNQAQTRDSLDGLAVKLGELQARILRLDAFGQRLAKAAGVKGEEFRFDEKPPQGGPMPAGSRELSVGEFQQMLDDISTRSTTAATSWACSIRSSSTTGSRARPSRRRCPWPWATTRRTSVIAWTRSPAGRPSTPAWI